MQPQDRFAALVEDFTGRPGVERPKGGKTFGASALKFEGSIFAMLKDDHLVVKLPAERVASLIGSGAATPFPPGKKHPMKQWATLQVEDDWSALAEEALELARAAG